MYQNVSRCLKKKKSLIFHSTLQFSKDTHTDNQDSILHLVISYKNNQKTFSEEKLVYEWTGMVSQLGGVLSLFLGFSFFSLISALLEFVDTQFKNGNCYSPKKKYPYIC